jgi:cold shock CspA family protein
LRFAPTLIAQTNRQLFGGTHAGRDASPGPHLIREMGWKRTKMPIGKVSYYDDGRGFGFITLKKGQAVSFEIVMDDRRGKPRSDKVRVVADTIAYDNAFLLTVD